MMKPKVSICIPTYRQVDFLRQTLNSVVAQKFTDYEIIISDDSPDDSVRDLISEFHFGEKLRYYRNEKSLGSPENWNSAIRGANGEYVKILHHDDMLAHADALGAFVDLLDDNPDANFGFSASRIEDAQSELVRESRPTDKQLLMLRATPEKLFLGNCIGAPSATICRREAALDYDKRMKWLVDIDFYIRILRQSKNFAYSSEVLIVTPTNAGHQVTEICNTDAETELYEYSLLYLKNVEYLAHDDDAMAFLSLFVGKYGSNALTGVINKHRDDFALKELMENVLVSYRQRPFLRFVNLIYWRLPAPLLVQKVVRVFTRFIYKILWRLGIVRGNWIVNF